MAKIIVSEFEKLDYRTTQETILAQISVDDMDENVGPEINIVNTTKQNLVVLNNPKHTVYIPAQLLPLENEPVADTHVYFELENYPFYQMAKEIIKQRADNSKPKGVFRYRRKVTEADDFILISDLIVIYSLLGEPINVQVTRSNQAVQPAHTIILLNFGEGTLAHVEYTVADEERIELEWSGVKSIIEFDSNEMNPFEPINKTKLPLMYSVDSILKNAKPFDQELVSQFTNIKKLINGGELK